MSFLELVRRAKSRSATPYPMVRIGTNRVVDSTPSGLSGFIPGQCYLEVRLAQIHLRNSGEWWQSFLPLASIVTDFQYKGERVSVPYIGGPTLLKDYLQGASGPVDIYNKRVAGPVPYAGDDVGIFAGLCRTATVDWAERTFEVLESVAKQLDVTRISSFVSIASPIVQGLESLIGMEKTQLRIAVEQQLVSGSAGGSSSALEPGWIALFAADAELEPSQIGVVNDRLHIRVDAGAPQPYSASDFVLLHVRALDRRDDYESFDFARVQWPRVQERLWAYQFEPAYAAFDALVASLMQCVDLTREQRKNLLVVYRGWFDEDRAQAQAVNDGTSRLDSTITRRDLGSAQLGEAATTTPAAVPRDIDLLMDAFAG